MLGESQNNWVIAMQVNSSSNMISPLDTIIMLSEEFAEKSYCTNLKYLHHKGTVDKNWKRCNF